MAKSRSSSSKRQREFQKRDRERRKAEKAAEKRLRRESASRGEATDHAITEKVENEDATITTRSAD